MSEPRTMAKTIDEILPGLFHYQIVDDRIDHISEAYGVVEGGTATLLDPLPLGGAALARLGPIGAIVIGGPGHQRSAWRYRRETKARVHAPEGTRGTEEAPDTTFKEDDRLPGGLRAVPAPGPHGPHFAFHLDRGPGVVFCTDLLMNEPDRGVVFLPARYMKDPAHGPESARRLLELEFDVLCFGHGMPITRGGRKALEDLLRRSR